MYQRLELTPVLEMEGCSIRRHYEPADIECEEQPCGINGELQPELLIVRALVLLTNWYAAKLEHAASSCGGTIHRSLHQALLGQSS